jgi:phosphoglucomutase
MTIMSIHALAGQPVPAHRVPDIAALVAAFGAQHPDPSAVEERVAFGTSGHRGSSHRRTFNADHILAIAQAVAEYRASRGIAGPMYVGKDTHALSAPALDVALDVLSANGVRLVRDSGATHTPTPVISHAILTARREDGNAAADGLILTPSHNPPEDGGIKYNPPHGGPADTDVTAAIEARANAILRTGLNDVPRRYRGDGGHAGDRGGDGVAGGEGGGLAASSDLQSTDLRRAYVRDLGSVIDMDVIAGEGVRIGVDPLGGASVDYWGEIADLYGLDIEVVNRGVDPTFSFMRLDWDGKVRMDCSSPYAMAGLIDLKDRFDVAVGLDPDADRHGIVTPGAGLMNPNHYLAVAVSDLFRRRPAWKDQAGVGKTVVSSSMIDRVAADLGRPLLEVPVGFKWFVAGLLTGDIAFAGEESAGATFLRRDGTPWTTDKDGILLCLLAAEITARTGRDPGELYRQLEDRFGSPVYERIDAPANEAQKAALRSLAADAVSAAELAGETIVERLTQAPGNDAHIGGLKVVTRNAWFAARPSGTEDVYKIYAESFLGSDHLGQVLDEAREMVAAAFRSAGV